MTIDANSRSARNKIMLATSTTLVRGVHTTAGAVLLALILTLGSTAAAAQQVAYEAHISGMVYGFLITTLLLMSRLLPRQGTDLLSILRQKRTEMTRLNHP